MSHTRKPHQFGVYRVETTQRFFVENHITEAGAKHAVACLQACAPDSTYVIDPPYGSLAPLKGKRRIVPFIVRLFSREPAPPRIEPKLEKDDASLKR